jgi:hypothetical protein
VPNRRSKTSTAVSSAPRKSFRQRYNEIEARRSELVARVSKLSESARSHPAYKRSLRLLNDTFRKGRLAQRIAILEAAAWLIDILERVAVVS